MHGLPVWQKVDGRYKFSKVLCLFTLLDGTEKGDGRYKFSKVLYIFTLIGHWLLRICSSITCQNRPNTVSKETEYSVKLDLIHCQNRPNTVSKET